MLAVLGFPWQAWTIECNGSSYTQETVFKEMVKNGLKPASNCWFVLCPSVFEVLPNSLRAWWDLCVAPIFRPSQPQLSGDLLVFIKSCDHCKQHNLQCRPTATNTGPSERQCEACNKRKKTCAANGQGRYANDHVRAHVGVTGSN